MLFRSKSLLTQSCQTRFVTPTPTPGRGQAKHHIPGVRQRGQRKPLAMQGLKRQRQPTQHLSGIHPHPIHELQGVLVSTQQDVLAVVQRQATVVHAASPATEFRRGFVQADRPAQAGGLHRSSQPCPATTDDGECVQNRPKACIFQASQSFRKGVSATRWCKTGYWACMISCSKVL